MRFRFFAITVVAVLLFATSCGNKDARVVWNDTLKKCSVSDLLGPKVLFFGASNNIGPGSVWRQRADGAYSPRWILSDAPVHKNSDATCQGKVTASFTLVAGASLDNAVAPVTGTLGIDLKRAKKIDLSPTSFRWDEVVEGPFEEYIRTKATQEVKADMVPANKRFVMQRALYISGLTATFEFDSTTGLNVKGKVKEGSIPASDLGINADA